MSATTDASVPLKWHGLDHLRALAILLVFIFHYFILSHAQPAWLEWMKFGWTGVDLFFVLSGFLIASQLFSEIKSGHRISFRRFFLKRFFRIIPTYLVTLFLYFCFSFFREKEALPELWRFLTFTHNLAMDIQHYGTFSHAWSLCVEEHFYLFLPLVLIFLQFSGLLRRSAWLLVLLFMAGFVLRYLSFENLYGPHASDDNSWKYWYRFIYYPTYTRLDGLLFGVMLAALVVFRAEAWQKLSKYGNVFLIAGLLVLTGAWFLCEDQMTFSASVFGFPLVAIGYVLIVAAAISPGTFLYRRSSRVTAFLAAVSYALYLTHKGVIHMTREWLGGSVSDANLLLLISFAACVLAAYLLHLLVEKPFMRLRRKLIV